VTPFYLIVRYLFRQVSIRLCGPPEPEHPAVYRTSCSKWHHHHACHTCMRSIYSRRKTTVINHSIVCITIPNCSRMDVILSRSTSNTLRKISTIIVTSNSLPSRV